MKSLFIIMFILFSTKSYSSLEKTCKGTTLFFDLGNTLVNTKDDPNHITYMPEAEVYLKKLKDSGCKLSLIVNIPESFGGTYEEKIKTLKAYVDDKWTESKPFTWDYFDEIHVPHSNKDLKPNPILFRLAFLNSWEKGKKVIYQGETAAEIDAAREIGMTAFLVGSRSDSFYLPFNEIKYNILKD